MNTASNIAHYGVLGMKWGRRKKVSANPSSDHTKTATLRKTKSLDEMSNDELRTIVTRLSLERQYKDVTARQKSAGEKFIRSFLEDQGKQQFNKWSQVAITKGTEKLTELLLSGKMDPP